MWIGQGSLSGGTQLELQLKNKYKTHWKPPLRLGTLSRILGSDPVTAARVRKSVTLIPGTLPLALAAPQSPGCLAEAPALQPPCPNCPTPLQCFSLVLCLGRPQGAALPVAGGSQCCKGDPDQGGIASLATRCFSLPLLLCFTSQQGPMPGIVGSCSHQHCVPQFC